MKTRMDTKKAFNVVLSQGPLLILLLLIIIASITYENFLSVDNLTNVLNQNSMLGIVALGFTFVILTGGFDLSIGSTLALCGVFYAQLSHVNIALAIVVPVIAGAAIGALNGVIICKTKIVPFVVTLATMFAIRGIVFVYTDELTVRVADTQAAAFLGRGTLFSVQVPILLFVALTILCVYISKYTRYGRYNFAIGGNEEAARNMGLPVDRVKTWVFSMSGAFAAFGGVVLTSRIAAAQPVAGQAWDMQALAVVVVGGTLLTGGVGSFFGTFIGTIIMGLVLNLINMQGDLSSFWQTVVRGAFLLIVVIVQRLVAIYQSKDAAEASG